MKTYEVTLNGRTPLLMHRDNIEMQDEIKLWQVENPTQGVAGDDRSPAWMWLASIATDSRGEYVAIPQSNIVAMIRDAAKQIMLKTLEPGANAKKSAMECAVANIMVQEDAVLRIGADQTIAYADLQAIAQLGDIDAEPETTDKKTKNEMKKEHLTEGKAAFTRQVEEVRTLGFSLDVRPVRIKQSRHIRVRPKFTDWSCSFTVIASGAFEKRKNIETLLTIAGSRVGIGDWRPGSGRPGVYGQFDYFLAQLSAAA